jgi:hypothetical protein
MKALKAALLVALLVSNEYAQDLTKRDPLLGRYILANSAEVVSITDLSPVPSQPRLTLTLCDFQPTGDIVSALTQAAFTDALGLASSRRAASATGDVNGDGRDELIDVWEGPAGGINVHVYMPRRQSADLSDWQWSGSPIPEFTADTATGPIRVVAANVNLTPRYEIIVCYRVEEGLKISLYDSVDEATQQPVLAASMLLAQSVFGIQDYDMAAGDLDHDGLEEIIFVFHTIEGTDHRLALYVAEVNPETQLVEWWGGNAFYMDAAEWISLKRLKIASGDFRNLGYDEAVVSATRAVGNTGRQVYSYVTIDTGAHSCDMSFPILSLSPAGWALGNGWESDAMAGDLNPLKEDGEELVVAGPGELAALKFDPSGTPSYLVKTALTNPGLLENSERRHFVAVADLDADTTSATTWMPEIILAEHLQDSTTDIRTFAVSLGTDNTIIDLSQIDSENFYGSGKTGKSELVAGDFDGDAIKIGPPKLVTVRSFGQPLVTLNVPPTHFDSVNGLVYDVCKAYGANVSQFKTKYSQKNSQASHFSSEMSESWGLATEVAAGFKFWGIKVRASIGQSFSLGYYGALSTEQTTTVTEEVTSWQDDLSLSTIADYDLWEYPLYAGGVYKGNAMVQIPHPDPFSPNRWLPAKDQRALTWMADHEVGNLLSYMPPSLFAPWVGSNLLTTFTSMTVSSGMQMHYSLDLEGKVSDESKLSNNVGCEVGLSVRGWGMEAKVSGTYAGEEVVTHTSTATDKVTIEVDLSAPDQAIPGTSYIVTPLVYWGENGSLVLNYAVELPQGSPGLETFWALNYGTKADPAFILPWRLDAEKGLGLISNMKLFCKSLHVSPVAPSAGDTAHITARVHNFSLKNMTTSVPVRFYLGNPTSGGTLIVGIGGLTELSTGPIDAQDRVTLEMDWVVPSGLDNTARVYAVIDPENSLEEIHEDNNMGFFPLWAGGTTGIADEVQPGVPDRCLLGQNYPNPFNPSTAIPYDLAERAHVKISVYDMLGRTVSTLVDDVVEAGRHHVVFDASGLATGMYLYRLQTGDYTMTRKMIVIR